MENRKCGMRDCQGIMKLEKEWELKGRNRKNGSRSQRKQKIIMQLYRCDTCKFTIRFPIKRPFEK